jgi:hypothetical protein
MAAPIVRRLLVKGAEFSRGSSLLVQRQSPQSRRFLTATGTRLPDLTKEKSSSSSRYFSSVDTANDADTAPLTAPRAVQQPPRPIFPWRHEPIDVLLPRLTLGTAEIAGDIVATPSGQAFFNALFLSNNNHGTARNIFDSFASYHWRDELAESSGWAFAQGVAAIMSNTYELPLEKVAKGDDEVKFSFPLEPESEDRTEDNNKGDSCDSVSTDETNEDSTTKDSNVSDDNSSVAEVESMVGKQLRELYKSAHASGHDQLRIRLEMIPTGRCHLHNLVGFPFVTRSAVAKDNVLQEILGEFTVARLARQGNYYGILNSMYEHIMLNHFGGEKDTRTKKDHFQTTVEIQVLVECDEIFCVMDAKTGAVLQGSPDGQRVWHLARFETTIETEILNRPNRWLPSISSRRTDNWQLTDIDDLLGPTTWYYGKLQ